MSKSKHLARLVAREFLPFFMQRAGSITAGALLTYGASSELATQVGATIAALVAFGVEKLVINKASN